MKARTCDCLLLRTGRVQIVDGQMLLAREQQQRANH